MAYTSPYQGTISFVQQRQRAYSTLASFPYGPPVYIAPELMKQLNKIPALPPPTTEQQPFTDSPNRVHLPLHPGLPYVVDASSLQMAVHHDPQHMFKAVHLLVQERDELRRVNIALRTESNTLKVERNTLSLENKSLAENFESVRLDYKVAREQLDTLEKICLVQSDKQVILWKFIERLRNGQAGPVGGDEYWKELTGSPMTAVSEASEPSSDHSSSSTAATKDSSETRLDPEAASPVTFKRDNVLTREKLPFNPQCASPSKPVQATLSNDSNNISNNSHVITNEVLKSIIVTLPARYFGVCPNSISAPGPCPFLHCRLQLLCEDFNDEHGKGCYNRACKLAHIYRTCTEMLDGVGCSYMQVRETSPKRTAHMKKRIHPVGAYPVSPKEWKMREAIAGLREAHRERRY